MALVSKTFSQIITFTRASTATYFDSTGTLQSAAVDAPRFDYNPSTLAAQGLLIEESRTNSLWYSEEFGNIAGWGTVGTAPTITTNSTTSPSGTLTADTITFAAADSRIQNEALLSFTAGLSYTITLYAKSVGTSLNKIRLAFFDGAQQNSSDFTVSNTAWTRLTVTFVAANTTATGRMQIRNATDNLANSIYIWGAQLEAGSFATSYIPTTTTALTRAADVASVNTLSPWFNSVEGTVYAEWTNLAATMPTGAAQVVARIGDATGNNFISLFQFQNASSKASQNMFSGGANPGRLDSGGAYSNATVKAAAAFAASDRALSTNGTAATTSATGAMPLSATRMGIGIDDTFNGPLNGYLRRITYYPRRLSNAELVSITS
jgi:hypothetical protein